MAKSGQFQLSEETLNDTTYIYDSIGGNVIFAIFAGTDIESVPTNNPEWNELAVTVSIDPQGANNEISEGKTLTNKEKEEIGYIIKNQSFWEKDKSGSAPVGILRGFIKNSDIAPNSIIENIIKNRCLSEKNRTLSGMEEIVNKYDFVNYQFDSLLNNLDFYTEEYKDLNDIEEYILEDSWLSDPGSDRLSMLFLQEQLIAIVHKRPMEISNTTAFDLPGKRTMLILPNVKTDLADKLLKFKTEFYTSFFE
ncbi:MAG: hypothetical protein MJZ33_04015 [Paludibacteraceae bacterium]|nr:hypothetical protein [Paludibacteraceae bacterium]